MQELATNHRLVRNVLYSETRSAYKAIRHGHILKRWNFELNRQCR